jgi:hypothetical protein
MSFTPTFPDDAPTGIEFYRFDGTLLIIEEAPGATFDPSVMPAILVPLEGDGDWQGAPAEAALPPLPVITGAWSTGDPKVVHVTVSWSTVWADSFGSQVMITELDENNDGVVDAVKKEVKSIGKVWAISPLIPVWVDTAVAKVEPLYAPDAFGSGPRTLKLTCANALSTGAKYRVTIDSPKDGFDRPWTSSATFLTRGENADTVGGESDGKILPAVLRAVGALMESAIGSPRTRTLGPLSHQSTEILVETTAHFPDSGDVFIGGLRFSYTSKSGGAEAYLFGLSTTALVVAPFPANTEVLLYAASVFPD